MSQPSFDNIEVSLKALHQESAQWERVSQVLAPVATFVADSQDISGVRWGSSPRRTRPTTRRVRS